MTEEELQEIRANRDRLAPDRYSAMVIDEYIRHVDALVTEVERLREYNQQLSDNSLILHRELAIQRRENAAMREIVQVVAAADPVSDEAREWSGVPGWLSVAIDRVWIAKARAILNK